MFGYMVLLELRSFDDVNYRIFLHFSNIAIRSYALYLFTLRILTHFRCEIIHNLIVRTNVVY